jgi:hypothetical protein
MSATAVPFGLKPSYHPSGVIRPDKGTIASAYGSNIFQGSPVAYVATGGIALAAAGAKAAGVFQGCEYNTPVGSSSQRVISNYWPAGQVATNIVAFLTTDPDIVYEVQANATLAITAIGRTYDWSANASANGDTFTGNSTVSLNVASVSAGGAGLIVLGLLEAMDNAWDDAFPVVLVKIAEPQFGAAIIPVY